MQFVVPQFIEVESKVIGPISVRQFIILLVTAGIMYVEFELFSIIPFAVIALLTLALGGLFAFAKVNSQPFHTFMLSFIQTVRRPKLSVWRRDAVPTTVVVKKGRKDKKDEDHYDVLSKPDVSQSHIAELSLIVDTSGKYSSADIARLREEQAIAKPDKPAEPGESEESNPPTQ